MRGSAPVRRELSRHRGGAGGGAVDRGGRGAPRLRVPLRERGVRRGPLRGRDHLHRAAAGRDPGDGGQDRVPPPRRRRGGQHDPRGGPGPRRRGRGGGRRPGDRLPGDAQGLGGGRRQGDADRGRGGRGARGIPRGHERGPRELRRRADLRRALRGAPAAHRDPGPWRRPRRGAPPRGARVLGAAPAPEGPRGGAVPLRRRRDAGADGGAGSGPRSCGRLRVGGNRRVHRGPGAPVLFPRDEHPAPGRAPGDGGGDRTRPRGVDDPDRGRRGAALHPGRRAHGRLGDGGAGLRGGPRARLPARDGKAPAVPPAPRPPGGWSGGGGGGGGKGRSRRVARRSAPTASGSTTGWRRAARSRCGTTP